MVRGSDADGWGRRRSAVEGSALFAGLGPGAHDAVSAAAELEPMAVGDVLVRQGDAVRSCYVLLSGTADVEIDGAVLDEVGPDECVGELAVLDDAPHTATVTATGAGEALRFAPDEFSSLLAVIPELRGRLTKALARRLRSTALAWAGVAADPGVLFGALCDLQSSGDESVRESARAYAARLARSTAATLPAPAADPLEPLTPAERRVACLVAEGMSNSAIAAELFNSRHTVESHLKRVYFKLNVSSRVQLAALVLRR